MAEARIVIVGGGFGGLFTALNLEGAGQITLVSDGDHFLFSPMLYEYLSGEVEEWQIAPKYAELINESVRVVQGRTQQIDLSNQKIMVEGHNEPLEYDVLVLAVGGTTNFRGVKGAEQYCLPFRKLHDADALRQRMVAALDRVPPDLPPQDARRALTFAVVGGGASGIELATKMADLLRDAFKRRALPGEPRVLVIEMSDKILPGMGEQIRTVVEEALLESHVEVHTLTRVVGVNEDSITVEHNNVQTQIETAAVVWVGGVKVSPLIEKLEVEKTRNNLIRVGQTLQVPSYQNVFALGDIAFYEATTPTLAGTAQLAYQEAGLAADNVRSWLKGEEMRTKYFDELGEAMSLGTERAAVLTAGKAFGGPLARQARFAMYTGRLPTWHHRLRVGASWFFGGTQPRPLLPLGIERNR
ncbi:MAG TPA: NAD(P)/FAD-dependent oxidoreductase [Pyrinomonadaceae bacterium]|nr:NAD(P)/FAD-dependent oxidoreductase [Pyrinomonadaceae bacterium]